MLNHATVLNAFLKHETLNIIDVCKPENLGLVPDGKQLQTVLNELTENKHLTLLASVVPPTYTITEAGIAAAHRLNEEESKVNPSSHAL